MKSFKSIIALLVFLTPFASQAIVGVCNDPLRDQDICKRMRHLRSQVNLLEAQRDLMQVNYPLLKALATDMDELTDELLANHNSTGILNGLHGVKEKIKPIIRYAKLKDARALRAANQVHAQCVACHSVKRPLSGYTWDTISKMTWGGINLKCNEEEATIRIREDGSLESVIEPMERTPGKVRNPYRCKSMHGMFSNFEYFLTGDDSNRLNFNMIEVSANEVLRISTDLKDKEMVHEGANYLFNDIQRRAREIATLARTKNTVVSTKRLEIVKSCSKCHNQDRGIPFSADFKQSPWN